jgi:hypothetical protein
VDELGLLFDLDIEYEPMEIELVNTDSFLTVRETLTRIGIYSKRTNILWQSVHLLQKRGKFYLVHFKELFALSGKDADLNENDVERRNRIAKLLQDWGLIRIIAKTQLAYMAPMNEIRIVSYKDKKNFILKTKYCMNTEKAEKLKETLK